MNHLLVLAEDLLVLVPFREKGTNLVYFGSTLQPGKNMKSDYVAAQICLCILFLLNNIIIAMKIHNFIGKYHSKIVASL